MARCASTNACADGYSYGTTDRVTATSPKPADAAKPRSAVADERRNGSLALAGRSNARITFRLSEMIGTRAGSDHVAVARQRPALRDFRMRPSASVRSARHINPQRQTTASIVAGGKLNSFA